LMEPKAKNLLTWLHVVIGAKWVAIATETSWPTGVKGILYPHHMK